MSINSTLIELEEVLRLRFTDVYSSLNEPALIDQFDRFRECTSIVIPDAVRAMYEWRNGQQPNRPEFYGAYSFIELDTVSLEIRRNRELARKYDDPKSTWANRLMPVFVFEGDSIAVLGASTSTRDSPVFAMSAEDPEVEVLAPTFSEYMRFMLAMYDEGGVALVENDFEILQSEVDADVRDSLHAKMFPELQDDSEGVSWFDTEKEYGVLEPWSD